MQKVVQIYFFKGIEIDVYDDIGDTLVVMPDEAGHGGSGSGRSIVQTVDECNGSEPEVDKKRPRIHKFVACFPVFF